MPPKTQEECLILLEQIRWGGVPTCPYCNSTHATAYKQERRYHCNNCFTSYSVTVGTLFHKTHVQLQKWFLAIQILEENKAISIRQLAERVRVNKNTSSYMMMRIKKAWSDEQALLKKLLEFMNS
jgi:transposase-like protein